MLSNSLWVRRLRKLGRRILSRPRAVIAAPVTACTHTRAVWDAERRGIAGPVLLVSVYREQNATLLQPIVDEARRHRWTVRLWALDQVAPALAGVTVGTGPGAKCPLVNGLVGGALGDWSWVVVVDDDFVLRRGSVAALLALAERGQLDLLQPAHTERSYLTFPITRRRALSLARHTTFVEGGPAFAVRGPWIERVLPYPERFEMGFGVELLWRDLGNEGARLGIVDAVALRHVRPVGGGGYVKAEEMARLGAELRTHGLVATAQIQRRLSTWRPWRDRPPWTDART